MSRADPSDTPCLLVVDDSEVDRYLLQRLLRRGGVDIEVCELEDGEVALDYVRRWRLNSNSVSSTPVAIMLDINMPRKNGLDFLDDFAQLCANEAMEPLPVVVMSTAQRRDEERRARAHPFVRGFLSKGALDPQELLALLGGVVQVSAPPKAGT